MKVLLVRPVAPNERFGLGPFFRIEPLGLAYVAAALERDGHEVRIVDLRFAGSIQRVLRAFRPELVGIAASHTLDTEEALGVARRVKAWNARAFVLVGGHAAAVYPTPFFAPEVDALCFEDGEQVVPDLVRALSERRPLDEVAGLWIRDRDATFGFRKGPVSATRISLDRVPLPSRHLMARFQHEYLCVNMRPVYLLETARGCPYRCTFCSIWQHVDRTFRFRELDYVVQDFMATGRNVFVADDLFFYPPARSLELARALARRGIKKHWMLVQTRTDIVARHPELLEAWRPLAERFDLFFGFEAPTDRGLHALAKDATTDDIVRAVAVCRELDAGVTGNFIVDPDWDEAEFHHLWDFKDRLGLYRAGYTILTPLPGTAYYEETKHRVREPSWSNFDMHHVLWEPRLGRERFFELFAESWRRTVLNAKGVRPWWHHLKGVQPRQIPQLLRVLYRTQRLVDPKAYLAEQFDPHLAAPPTSAPDPRCAEHSGRTLPNAMRAAAS
ncbi:MAG: cobalamin-dependent protein [Deltaproteobacteria bacterium]|nr:cobalamin-dependent protein [Deltaproteobacteria bacterium]